MSGIYRRRAWAHELISRCDKPPATYGSPEWQALPDGPEKVAAVVVAAECWALDGDKLEERLRAEVEALRKGHKAADDAEYVARREAHAVDWTGASFRPDPYLAQDLDREWREWSGGDVA